MKIKEIHEDYKQVQFNEAYKILKQRLKKNNISNSIIKNKKILNICDPSGRYTIALYKLGAKVVDTYNETSKPKIWKTKYKFKKINLNNKIISKLNYDLVFCNGILSHKRNWKKILINLFNVLDKEGYLWLSLYSNGQHWKNADKIKEKLSKKLINNFIRSLQLRDWQPNKINFLTELFFKERIYFTKKEISYFLKKYNFSEIIYLNRGIKTDLNEKIYNDKKLKKIYGEGEIRLLAKRKNK